MHILGYYDKGDGSMPQCFLSNLGYTDLCDNGIVPREDKQYYLALDQATKATGIALVSTDLEFMLIMTIISNFSQAIDKSKFFDALSEFILALTMGLDVKAVAFEEVPPTEYSRTRRVLEEWKATLSQALYSFPDLAKIPNSHRFSVLPNVWKSSIRDVSAGTNRTGSKIEMSKDICKLVPRLSPYLEYLHTFNNHAYDGFDAMGLIYYMNTMCFQGDDIINNGLITKMTTFSVVYAYTSSETMKLVNEYLSLVFSGLVSVRIWQPDKTIFENFSMAVNSGLPVLMKVNSTTLLVSYLIEFADTYVENFDLWVLVGSTRRYLRKDVCHKMEEFGFRSRIYR